MKKQIIFLLLIITLAGCRTYGRINLTRISLGMSRSEVQHKLKRKPDNLIGSRQYPEGIVEVLQYSRYDPWFAQLQERYYLYFLNDKLVTWGRPGDWESQADKIYEFRYR